MRIGSRFSRLFLSILLVIFILINALEVYLGPFLDFVYLGMANIILLAICLIIISLCLRSFDSDNCHKLSDGPRELVALNNRHALEKKQKEFVSNVSHELRTPLTTIISYLEALDDGAIEDVTLKRRFLGVARQEADRMTRLIQDLLHLSKLDEGTADLTRQEILAQELVLEAINRFSVQCKQHNISLAYHLDDQSSSIYINHDKIIQVLDNLISNSIKYARANSGIAIIYSALENGSVEIAVADSGMGIPQEDLEHIFERFYRVDKARSRRLGGTGLGLSIAQEIIQAHGGDIGIYSVYDKGTIIFFNIPS